MDETQTNSVLKSLEPVISNASYITINEEAIKEVAKTVTDKQLGLTQDEWWRAPVFPENDDDNTINYFFLLNSLNFKFWHSDDPNNKFQLDYKDIHWKGAFGLAASLTRAIEEGKPLLDADYLANISSEDVEDIFRGTEYMPMVEERADILREVGTVLNEKYNGSFVNLVKEANFKAFDNGKGIVERLVSDFPSYNDVSEYNGEKVEFQKRAQLAVGMLYNRLKDTDLFKVDDVNELTVFADYQLPKTLRNMGIISYNDELAETVDTQQLIPKDSPQEIELRAFTIYAADLLLKEVNNYRESQGQDSVNALNVDYCLWLSGRENPEGFHHLTETIAY